MGDDAYEGNYGLDYPPLRLLVTSIWAKKVQAKFPGVEDGTPDYVQPLLHINLLGCVAIWVWDTLPKRPPSLGLRPAPSAPVEDAALALAAVAQKA